MIMKAPAFGFLMLLDIERVFCVLFCIKCKTLSKIVVGMCVRMSVYMFQYTHTLRIASAAQPGQSHAPGIITHLLCGQVSQDGKSLLDKLQRPLTPGSSDSLTASANYSKAVHHVLDVIHEVLHHQRQLENIWQHRKVRLHQRLQLCVFQQDVQQVSFPLHSSWEWLVLSQLWGVHWHLGIVCVLEEWTARTGASSLTAGGCAHRPLSALVPVTEHIR